MALSIAIVILASLAADHLLRRVRLPGLLGFLLVGLLCGPHGLNLLNPALLAVSGDFRRVALVVILLRAGLMISRTDLQKVGRPALLMACLPALCEGAVIALLAPRLLGLAVPQALVLGAVLAAVGPAVVVPAMLKLQHDGRGTDKGIPTLLLAASPLDNVLVLVLFGALLQGAQGSYASLPLKLAELPISLAVGGLVGLVLGKRLYRGFLRFDPRATKRVLIVLCLSILLLGLEDALHGRFPFSGLIAVMALGLMLLEKSEPFAHEMSAKLAKIWIFAEILLFALLGAQVDLHAVGQVLAPGLLLIACGLCGRCLGAWLALLRTRLNLRERLFCVVGFLPKASVQAAIGALPLAAGLAGGSAILSVAVLAILVTAPLGALAIETLGPRWLEPSPVQPALDEV